MGERRGEEWDEGGERGQQERGRKTAVNDTTYSMQMESASHTTAQASQAICNKTSHTFLV